MPNFLLSDPFTIFIGLVLLVFASWFIAKACDFFEASTTYLGRNMSEGVRGATLNAIGSSLPELLTTVFFLLNAKDISGLGVQLGASISGDSGSAVFNSLVIPFLVIIAVVRLGMMPKVSKKVVLRDGGFLIAAEIILLFMFSGGHIEWWHGAILTGFYLIYLTFLLTRPKKNDDEAEEEDHPKYANTTWKAWGTLILSTGVIALMCHQLIEAVEMITEGVVSLMNLSASTAEKVYMFLSLILIAGASSVPDTIISVKDAKKGNYEDALSNVLGSNIFDITISMGLPLMVYLLITGYSIEFQSAANILIPVRITLLVCTLLAIFIFIKYGKALGKKQAVGLGLIYLAFIIYNAVTIFA